MSTRWSFFVTGREQRFSSERELVINFVLCGSGVFFQWLWGLKRKQKWPFGTRVEKMIPYFTFPALKPWGTRVMGRYCPGHVWPGNWSYCIFVLGPAEAGWKWFSFVEIALGSVQGKAWRRLLLCRTQPLMPKSSPKIATLGDWSGVWGALGPSCNPLWQTVKSFSIAVSAKICQLALK